MSKVYSFRFDDNNPREAQAREVIEVWISKGYSLRHLLTEALNSFSECKDSHTDVLYLIKQLGEIIRTPRVQLEGIGEDNKSRNSLPLSSVFVSELGKSIKPGIRKDKVNVVP